MSERLKRRAAFAALLLVGLGMAWMSWRKWCDPYVDFGHQLYVAWQLTEGQVLYKDIQYVYGPFSVHFNALLFRLFGVHLLTLALFNHLLVALLAWLIFRVFEELADFAAAFACAGLFLVVFAFSQYTVIGNENYVTPYSHEMLHSLVFSWTALWLFLRYLEDRRTGRLWAIGILAGLIFLAKVEVFLAVSVSLAAGFAAVISAERIPAGRAVRMLAVSAAGFAVPPAAFFLLFCKWMSPGAALHALVNQYLLIGKVNKVGPYTALYAWMMGIDYPRINVLEILVGLEWHAVLLVGLAIVCWTARRAGNENRSRLVWAAASAAIVWLYFRLPWVLLFRPGTLYLPLACAWLAWEVWRRRADPDEARLWTGRLALAVFASALFGKILLKVSVLYYGFALAMPAILCMAAFAIHGLPRIAARFAGPDAAVKPVLLFFFAVCALWYLNQCRETYAYHTFRIGPPDGGDWVYDVTPRKDFQEKLYQRIYEKMEELKRPGQTLVAFPGPVIFNYWTRLRSPTHMTDYTLTMLDFNGGEQDVVRRLDQSPPDWALLHDTDCSLRRGDPGHLGRDYGFLLSDWIRSHYEPVYQVAPPDRSTFGVLILRRKERA